MSWEVNRAIARIFNTFKRVKNGIYPEDVEALKVLNEMNEKKAKEFVTGNLVFAKLYCLSLRQNLNYYGDIKTAIKGISSELSKPLDFQIEMLTKEINQNDLNNFLKEKGIDLTETYFQDSKKGQEEINILKDNEKEIINQLSKNWSYKNIETSFYKSANDVLKDLNHYE